MQDTGSSFKKSDEWIERRKKTIGGSDIGVICGRSPYKTAYQLWLEKTGRVQMPDISHLPHIARGHLSEEIARGRLERETLTSYRPKFWRHAECEYMAVNDDGFSVDHNHFLEIKAMGLANHNIVKEGAKAESYESRVASIPEYYIDQIQFNLMVSGCEKCIFISYRVEDDDMVCIDVLPDKKLQKELFESAKYFFEVNMAQDIPPALTDKDYVKVADKDLDEKLKRYKEIKEQVAVLEGEAEAIKEGARKYISGHPAVQTPEGFRLSLSARQGSVDYQRLCKEKSIAKEEVEKYRKKPVEVYTIRLP